MARDDDEVNEVADAIRYAARHLGTNDAATPMGAIEAHGVMIIEAAEKVQHGLQEIAEALRDIASAIDAQAPEDR